MQFSCTEEEKPGFVHHVYECAKCRSIQSFIACLSVSVIAGSRRSAPQWGMPSSAATWSSWG
jgi:hypothetical protein